MSLDIVIPAYTKDAFLEDMLIRCIKSYRGQAKIIVSEDGGIFSEKVSNECDSYLWNRQNLGFTKNVNRGWRYSTADYTAIINSDTELSEGNLSDLCIPGKVTSPSVINQDMDGMCGSFFVVPKDISKEGLLREEMITYYSDTEFAVRHKDRFQKVESVKITHKRCATINNIRLAQNEHSDRDRYEYDRLAKL